MRVWIFVLAGISAAFAADEQRLALVAKAQTSFDRVAAAAAPDLRDAIACVQTQAALLSVAFPEEASEAHFRKGYCLLTSATVTQSRGEFTEASAEFDKAIESWPARVQAALRKKIPAPPLSAGLRVLAPLSLLEAGADGPQSQHAEQELSLALTAPDCSSNVMPVALCEQTVELGHHWLGWMALRRDELAEATRHFSRAQGSGWPEWVAGRKAFVYGKYGEAASQYRDAIGLFERGPGASLMSRLEPPRDLEAKWREAGGAWLLAHDAPAALAALDAAVKAGPSDAQALFLRARAKELAGEKESALSDYNLASRTAFANAKDLSSGEAHLYRGILLYRRNDFPHAEDEFSSALNFDISTAMRSDAVAWRHMAAVASGSCAASRRFLEDALITVSPYFPKDEARGLMSKCPVMVSSGPALR